MPRQNRHIETQCRAQHLDLGGQFVQHIGHRRQMGRYVAFIAHAASPKS
jgi:hypothetical protein